jgi:hypothetical protein
MSSPSEKRRQVYDLTDALLTGVLDAKEAHRLNDLVCNDAEARRHYVRFMHDSAMLHQWAEDAPAAEVVPPIIVDSSPDARRPLAVSLSPGGFLFSYVVGAVLLGIGLLAGWTWTVSGYHPLPLTLGAAPQALPSAESEPVAPSVGRITGLVDCRWASPQAGLPAYPAFTGDAVALGRRYDLASGFMEITYDTGATVVLQGPAVYEVESASGGFLSLGKLAARVESRESSVKSSDRQRNGSQLSTLNSRLFSVRTPTAIVTDLGTEFGVEVEKSGTTKSHVFRGRIDVRPVGGGIQDPKPVLLGENESATVDARPSGPVAVVRRENPSTAPAFAVRLPQRVPIKLFSTGIGLKEGEPDPRWQIVIKRGDSSPQPRAAVVATAAREYLTNDPARSQWLSTSGDLSPAPRGTYTFRTTFDLADASPEWTVLRGRFLADNRVEAIRLNNHRVSVPKHESIAPFDQYHSFVAAKGFVAGRNVLEIDVYNLQSSQGTLTPMALRVELEGAALRQALPAAVPPDKHHGPSKP